MDYFKVKKESRYVRGSKKLRYVSGTVYLVTKRT